MSSVGTLELEAIGRVEASRTQAEDDYWGEEQSCIVLDDRFSPDALDGLEEFSHVEVLFAFHQVDPAKIVSGARHPSQKKPTGRRSASSHSTARIGPIASEARSVA